MKLIIAIIQPEELPDITFNRVRVSVSYPGASAQDVEYFVTKPMEEELQGIDGVRQITSTSSAGRASISIEIEQDYANIDEAVTEIRNTVLDVDLPDDIIDDPDVRVFKTSKKAILDVALIHKDRRILDTESRRELQKYAFALYNQLMALPEINSVDKQSYLQEELQIKIDPVKLSRFDIPFNTVMREIRENHFRKPAGNLQTKQEPKVTLLSELDTPEKLSQFIIQGGFEGQVIRLGEVADITSGYEKNESVYKVNGYEAVMFSVVKNSAYGILEAIEAVNRAVERFRDNNLKDAPIEVVLLDDESIDVRNRLGLITINGGIGFILILITLFIFLNKRAGLWVAMGIPFTLCFTLIAGSWMGYTINGTTLAAVIIVLGIVVDDAIVVAENISRLIQQGVEKSRAVIEGTVFVFLPVVASIVTTCIAFVPLFFFTGRFSRFIESIPVIIFLMLGASLFESMFILPGHMNLDPFFFRPRKKSVSSGPENHWFETVEDAYGALLKKVLPYKWLVFVFFIVTAILVSWAASQSMKFVMFPDEETRDIVLSGKVPPAFTRYETAAKAGEVEDLLIPYLGKEGVGFRTQVARSRRGGAVEENTFRTNFEIVPKEKRKKSADQIIRELESRIAGLEGFEEVKFRKSRWGQDSGSPIELRVQQNNDKIRAEIVSAVADAMRAHPELENIEIEKNLVVPEYQVSVDQEKIKRLSISPQDIASTLRAALEGTVLYDFSNGDEDVHTRLTILESSKDDIEHVLNIPVENQQNYLVPLRDIVKVEAVQSPNSITRYDLKRTTMVYADLKKGASKSPLEIAEELESEAFPPILSKHPTTTLFFGGEVQDTRESKQDLRNAILMVLLLIYFVLAALFNSLTKPVIIMLSIPFGVVGVLLAFYLHGKTLFGFYAAIGALGLAGVVINDSIVMLAKFDHEFDPSRPASDRTGQVADIAKTRLKAVLLTTLTTVVGVLPTAYGLMGYDAMLADMMLALSWGLMFGTFVTLLLIPCMYDLWHASRSKIVQWKMFSP